MIPMRNYVIGFLMIAVLSGCKTDHQRLNERARAYVAAHADLDRRTAADIAANRIHKGMTKEQVIAAWGEPVVIQHFDNAVEYWYFGCVWPHQCNSLSFGMSPEEQYLSRALFRDGKVMEWQD